MTWEIVVGISVLLGMSGTVIGVSTKLSKSIATLEATINMLNETMKSFQKDNKEEHRAFHERLDSHESRIVRLESRNP